MLPKRASLAIATTVCAAVIGGCGSAAQPAAPPVRLSVDSPADGTTTLGSQVVVSGTVAPGAATVLVAGQQVAVSGGSFSARVPVRPGANVIDVLAGAPRAPAAMSAVRVYRLLPVAVPAVEGQSSSTAVTTLTRLGLRPRVHDVGGFLQSLLPMSEQVCSTDPPAGQLLAPGSAVQLQVAVFC